MKNNIKALLAFLLFSTVIHAGTLQVINTQDSGIGSLRQAIIDANTNIGADTINFNIANTDCDANGVCHIQLLTALDDITDELIIDGTSQARFGLAPSNVCAVENNASYMRIELNGTSNFTYLTLISANPSVIKGLSIGEEVNNNRGEGISLVGDANHLVQCNHLGIDAQGVEKLGLFTGICIGCSSPFGDNSTIGTNSDGINDISERNIIASNSGIFQNTGKNIIVAGNYFGITADGMVKLDSFRCIHSRQSGNDSRYGSNLDGINDLVEKNIFNCDSGITSSLHGGVSVTIAGNWFGVNAIKESLNSVVTAITMDGILSNSTPSFLIASNLIHSVQTAIEVNNQSFIAVGSRDNCIVDSQVGVKHQGTQNNLRLTNNWWGDSSGPSGLGFGVGAQLIETSTGTIDFDPWSTTPVCLNYLEEIYKDGFE